MGDICLGLEIYYFWQNKSYKTFTRDGSTATPIDVGSRL